MIDKPTNIGKKKAARTTVMLPSGVHQRAKIAAARLGIKIQALVAQAVTEKLDDMDTRERELAALSAVPRKRHG